MAFGSVWWGNIIVYEDTYIPNIVRLRFHRFMKCCWGGEIALVCAQNTSNILHNKKGDGLPAVANKNKRTHQLLLSQLNHLQRPYNEAFHIPALQTPIVDVHVQNHGQWEVIAVSKTFDSSDWNRVNLGFFFTVKAFFSEQLLLKHLVVSTVQM